jgi:hypothetical protein
MAKYDRQISPRIGDQAFCEDQLAAHGITPEIFKDVCGRFSVASYKVDKCQEAPPDGAAVVAYHGSPKPHEIKTGWVPKTWI